MGVSAGLYGRAVDLVETMSMVGRLTNLVVLVSPEVTQLE